MSHFQTFEELERASRIEHGTEIAPGVVIARRSFVFGALASGAALLTACQSSSSTRLVRVSNNERALEDFVHALRPRARALVAAAEPDEEAYLEYAARALARLQAPEVGIEELEAGKWNMKSRCHFRPIAVFEMRLAPGARLELHDHRDYNGVLSCVKGSVRCANFDIVGDVAAARAQSGDTPFRVKRVSEQTLRPGDVSTLARAVRNLHELEAGPEGAVLYDAFTYFEAAAGSHTVLLGQRVADELDNFGVSRCGPYAEYEARWARG